MGKKDVAIWYVGMDSDGVAYGNMEMGKKKGNRGNLGEIHKMITKSRLENATIHGKGGSRKAQNENEGRQESMRKRPCTKVYKSKK